MKTTPQLFLVFFITFYMVWAVRATVFYSTVDLAIPGETGRLIFSNIVKFVLWVVPAAVYVARLERDDPLVQMKITTPVDRRGLLTGLLVSLLYFIAVFSFEKFQSGRTLAALLRAPAGAWLAAFAISFLSPISEEIMFRGFVLPHLSSRMGFWKANLLQAVLFTAMHWPSWLWTAGFQAGILTTSLGIFLLAVLLGWLLRRTNSVWPPVAVHILNNFLAGFLG
jgi:membrane protease YdiL (CAAX protease family)